MDLNEHSNIGTDLKLHPCHIAGVASRTDPDWPSLLRFPVEDARNPIHVGFWDCFEQYVAEEEASTTLRPAATATLRHFTKMARADKAASAEELGQKIKIAATIGAAVVAKRSSKNAAIWFQGWWRCYFIGLPWTFCLDAMGFDAVAAKGRPRQIGPATQAMVAEMVEAAGPLWFASVVLDIARLQDCATWTGSSL